MNAAVFQSELIRVFSSPSFETLLPNFYCILTSLPVNGLISSIVSEKVRVTSASLTYFGVFRISQKLVIIVTLKRFCNKQPALPLQLGLDEKRRHPELFLTVLAFVGLK